MEHVLWIGGAPGAGKTTVATLIARRHGLRWYGADTRTWEHRDRALREGNAAAHRWEAMDPAERWMTPMPEEMLAMSLHRERGAMVVDDLRALPRAPLVVAEGTTLPAWAVRAPSRAVWLIPTREFQERAFAERQLAPGVAALYRLHTDVVAQEAREHGVRVLTIDGAKNILAVASEVEGLFGEALAAGPRAETSDERHRLLREANLTIVEQVRGYYARPWASGDPEAVEREFLCECGDPTCDAQVLAPIAAAVAAAVFAPNHGKVRAVSQLREFAERYTAAWCSGDPESVAAHYARDGSLTINDGEPSIGRAAITEAAQSFMTAFPDMQVLLDSVVVNDNGGEYHWTLIGTNTGPGGTGHRVRISGFEEWTIGDDGLIAASLGHYDQAEYDRQLAEGV